MIVSSRQTTIDSQSKIHNRAILQEHIFWRWLRIQLKMQSFFEGLCNTYRYSSSFKGAENVKITLSSATKMHCWAEVVVSVIMLYSNILSTVSCTLSIRNTNSIRLPIAIFELSRDREWKVSSWATVFISHL